MTPKPWSPSPDLEGFIPFVVDGNTYQTWYRVFGDLKASTTPLVALHGGPGLTHDYLLPISDLAANGTAVIFYDQLGNGRSTHLPDLPTSFWTVDLFINELVNLLSHFKVDSDFALLGHSWGGMCMLRPIMPELLLTMDTGILALEFEIRRKPEGLKKLVLSSSLADMKAWNESNARLVQAFPKEIQEAMAVGMKDLKVSGPAMKEFRAVHGCSLKPFPEEYLYSLDQAMIVDPTVGKAM